MSQRRKISNIKKDKYPGGINAKARSGESKKGLGCEYRDESSPACKKKSNPIIEAQDKSVSLMRWPLVRIERLDGSMYIISRIV